MKPEAIDALKRDEEEARADMETYGYGNVTWEAQQAKKRHKKAKDALEEAQAIGTGGLEGERAAAIKLQKHAEREAELGGDAARERLKKLADQLRDFVLALETTKVIQDIATGIRLATERIKRDVEVYSKLSSPTTGYLGGVGYAGEVNVGKNYWEITSQERVAKENPTLYTQARKNEEQLQAMVSGAKEMEAARDTARKHQIDAENLQKNLREQGGENLLGRPKIEEESMQGLREEMQKRIDVEKDDKKKGELQKELAQHEEDYAKAPAERRKSDKKAAEEIEKYKKQIEQLDEAIKKSRAEIENFRKDIYDVMKTFATSDWIAKIKNSLDELTRNMTKELLLIPAKFAEAYRAAPLTGATAGFAMPTQINIGKTELEMTAQERVLASNRPLHDRAAGAQMNLVARSSEITQLETQLAHAQSQLITAPANTDEQTLINLRNSIQMLGDQLAATKDAFEREREVAKEAIEAYKKAHWIEEVKQVLLQTGLELRKSVIELGLTFQRSKMFSEVYGPMKGVAWAGEPPKAPQNIYELTSGQLMAKYGGSTYEAGMRANTMREGMKTAVTKYDQQIAQLQVERDAGGEIGRRAEEKLPYVEEEKRKLIAAYEEEKGAIDGMVAAVMSANARFEVLREGLQAIKAVIGTISQAIGQLTTMQLKSPVAGAMRGVAEYQWQDVKGEHELTGHQVVNKYAPGLARSAHIREQELNMLSEQAGQAQSKQQENLFMSTMVEDPLEKRAFETKAMLYGRMSDMFASHAEQARVALEPLIEKLNMLAKAAEVAQKLEQLAIQLEVLKNTRYGMDTIQMEAELGRHPSSISRTSLTETIKGQEYVIPGLGGLGGGIQIPGVSAPRGVGAGYYRTQYQEIPGMQDEFGEAVKVPVAFQPGSKEWQQRELLGIKRSQGVITPQEYAQQNRTLQTKAYEEQVQYLQRREDQKFDRQKGIVTQAEGTIEESLAAYGTQFPGLKGMLDPMRKKIKDDMLHAADIVGTDASGALTRRGFKSLDELKPTADLIKQMIKSEDAANTARYTWWPIVRQLKELQDAITHEFSQPTEEETKAQAQFEGREKYFMNRLNDLLVKGNMPGEPGQAGGMFGAGKPLTEEERQKREDAKIKSIEDRKDWTGMNTGTGVQVNDDTSNKIYEKYVEKWKGQSEKEGMAAKFRGGQGVDDTILKTVYGSEKSPGILGGSMFSQLKSMTGAEEAEWLSGMKQRAAGNEEAMTFAQAQADNMVMATNHGIRSSQGREMWRTINYQPAMDLQQENAYLQTPGGENYAGLMKQADEAGVTSAQGRESMRGMDVVMDKAVKQHLVGMDKLFSEYFDKKKGDTSPGQSGDSAPATTFTNSPYSSSDVPISMGAYRGGSVSAYFADGGFVPPSQVTQGGAGRYISGGPSGTDMIAAVGPKGEFVKLDQGEFIVSADNTAKYHDALEAMNSGTLSIATFAGGGYAPGGQDGQDSFKDVFTAIQPGLNAGFNPVPVRDSFQKLGSFFDQVLVKMSGSHAKNADKLTELSATVSRITRDLLGFADAIKKAKDAEKSSTPTIGFKGKPEEGEQSRDTEKGRYGTYYSGSGFDRSRSGGGIGRYARLVDEFPGMGTDSMITDTEGNGIPMNQPLARRAPGRQEGGAYQQAWNYHLGKQWSKEHGGISQIEEQERKGEEMWNAPVSGEPPKGSKKGVDDLSSFPKLAYLPPEERENYKRQLLAKNELFMKPSGGSAYNREEEENLWGGPDEGGISQAPPINTPGVFTASLGTGTATDVGGVSGLRSRSSISFGNDPYALSHKEVIQRMREIKEKGQQVGGPSYEGRVYAEGEDALKMVDRFANPNLESNYIEHTENVSKIPGFVPERAILGKDLLTPPQRVKQQLSGAFGFLGDKTSEVRGSLSDTYHKYYPRLPIPLKKVVRPIMKTVDTALSSLTHKFASGKQATRQDIPLYYGLMPFVRGQTLAASGRQNDPDMLEHNDKLMDTIRDQGFIPVDQHAGNKMIPDSRYQAKEALVSIDSGSVKPFSTSGDPWQTRTLEGLSDLFKSPLSSPSLFKTPQKTEPVTFRSRETEKEVPPYSLRSRSSIGLMDAFKAHYGVADLGRPSSYQIQTTPQSPFRLLGEGSYGSAWQHAAFPGEVLKVQALAPASDPRRTKEILQQFPHIRKYASLPDRAKAYPSGWAISTMPHVAQALGPQAKPVGMGQSDPVVLQGLHNWYGELVKKTGAALPDPHGQNIFTDETQTRFHAIDADTIHRADMANVDMGTLHYPLTHSYATASGLDVNKPSGLLKSRAPDLMMLHNLAYGPRANLGLLFGLENRTTKPAEMTREWIKEAVDYLHTARQKGDTSAYDYFANRQIWDLALQERSSSQETIDMREMALRSTRGRHGNLKYSTPVMTYTEASSHLDMDLAQKVTPSGVDDAFAKRLPTASNPSKLRVAYGLMKRAAEAQQKEQSALRSRSSIEVPEHYRQAEEHMNAAEHPMKAGTKWAEVPGTFAVNAMSEAGPRSADPGEPPSLGYRGISDFYESQIGKYPEYERASSLMDSRSNRGLYGTGYGGKYDYIKTLRVGMAGYPTARWMSSRDAGSRIDPRGTGRLNPQGRNQIDMPLKNILQEGAGEYGELGANMKSMMKTWFGYTWNRQLPDMEKAGKVRIDPNRIAPFNVDNFVKDSLEEHFPTIPTKERNQIVEHVKSLPLFGREREGILSEIHKQQRWVPVYQGEEKGWAMTPDPHARQRDVLRAISPHIEAVTGMSKEEQEKVLRSRSSIDMGLSAAEINQQVRQRPMTPEDLAGLQVAQMKKEGTYEGGFRKYYKDNLGIKTLSGMENKHKMAVRGMFFNNLVSQQKEKYGEQLPTPEEYEKGGTTQGLRSRADLATAVRSPQQEVEALKKQYDDLSKVFYKRRDFGSPEYKQADEQVTDAYAAYHRKEKELLPQQFHERQDRESRGYEADYRKKGDTDMADFYKGQVEENRREAKKAGIEIPEAGASELTKAVEARASQIADEKALVQSQLDVINKEKAVVDERKSATAKEEKIATEKTTPPTEQPRPAAAEPKAGLRFPPGTPEEALDRLKAQRAKQIPMPEGSLPVIEGKGLPAESRGAWQNAKDRMRQALDMGTYDKYEVTPPELKTKLPEVKPEEATDVFAKDRAAIEREKGWGGKIRGAVEGSLYGFKQLGSQRAIEKSIGRQDIGLVRNIAEEAGLVKPGEKLEEREIRQKLSDRLNEMRERGARVVEHTPGATEGGLWSVEHRAGSEYNQKGELDAFVASQVEGGVAKVSTEGQGVIEKKTGQSRKLGFHEEGHATVRKLGEAEPETLARIEEQLLASDKTKERYQQLKNEAIAERAQVGRKIDENEARDEALAKMSETSEGYAAAREASPEFESSIHKPLTEEVGVTSREQAREMLGRRGEAKLVGKNVGIQSLGAANRGIAGVERSLTSGILGQLVMAESFVDPFKKTLEKDPGNILSAAGSAATLSYTGLTSFMGGAHKVSSMFPEIPKGGKLSLPLEATKLASLPLKFDMGRLYSAAATGAVESVIGPLLTENEEVRKLSHRLGGEDIGKGLTKWGGSAAKSLKTPLVGGVSAWDVGAEGLDVTKSFMHGVEGLSGIDFAYRKATGDKHGSFFETGQEGVKQLLKGFIAPFAQIATGAGSEVDKEGNIASKKEAIDKFFTPLETAITLANVAVEKSQLSEGTKGLVGGGLGMYSKLVQLTKGFTKYGSESANRLAYQGDESRLQAMLDVAPEEQMAKPELELYRDAQAKLKEGVASKDLTKDEQEALKKGRDIQESLRREVASGKGAWKEKTPFGEVGLVSAAKRSIIEQEKQQEQEQLRVTEDGKKAVQPKDRNKELLSDYDKLAGKRGELVADITGISANSRDYQRDQLFGPSPEELKKELETVDNAMAVNKKMRAAIKAQKEVTSTRTQDLGHVLETPETSTGLSQDIFPSMTKQMIDLTANAPAPPETVQEQRAAALDISDPVSLYRGGYPTFKERLKGAFGGDIGSSLFGATEVPTPTKKREDVYVDEHGKMRQIPVHRSFADAFTGGRPRGQTQDRGRPQDGRRGQTPDTRHGGLGAGQILKVFVVNFPRSLGGPGVNNQTGLGGGAQDRTPEQAAAVAAVAGAKAMKQDRGATVAVAGSYLPQHEAPTGKFTETKRLEELPEEHQQKLFDEHLRKQGKDIETMTPEEKAQSFKDFTNAKQGERFETGRQVVPESKEVLKQAGNKYEAEKEMGAADISIKDAQRRIAEASSTIYRLQESRPIGVGPPPASAQKEIDQAKEQKAKAEEDLKLAQERKDKAGKTRENAEAYIEGAGEAWGGKKKPAQTPEQMEVDRAKLKEARQWRQTTETQEGLNPEPLSPDYEKRMKELRDKNPELAKKYEESLNTSARSGGWSEDMESQLQQMKKDKAGMEKNLEGKTPEETEQNRYKSAKFQSLQRRVTLFEQQKGLAALTAEYGGGAGGAGKEQQPGMGGTGVGMAATAEGGIPGQTTPDTRVRPEGADMGALGFKLDESILKVFITNWPPIFGPQNGQVGSTGQLSNQWNQPNMGGQPTGPVGPGGHSVITGIGNLLGLDAHFPKPETQMRDSEKIIKDLKDFFAGHDRPDFDLKYQKDGAVMAGMSRDGILKDRATTPFDSLYDPAYYGGKAGRPIGHDALLHPPPELLAEAAKNLGSISPLPAQIDATNPTAPNEPWLKSVGSKDNLYTSVDASLSADDRLKMYQQQVEYAKPKEKGGTGLSLSTTAWERYDKTKEEVRQEEIEEAGNKALPMIPNLSDTRARTNATASIADQQRSNIPYVTAGSYAQTQTQAQPSTTPRAGEAGTQGLPVTVMNWPDALTRKDTSTVVGDSISQLQDALTKAIENLQKANEPQGTIGTPEQNAPLVETAPPGSPELEQTRALANAQVAAQGLGNAQEQLISSTNPQDVNTAQGNVDRYTAMQNAAQAQVEAAIQAQITSPSTATEQQPGQAATGTSAPADMGAILGVLGEIRDRLSGGKGGEQGGGDLAGTLTQLAKAVDGLAKTKFEAVLPDKTVSSVAERVGQNLGINKPEIEKLFAAAVDMVRATAMDVDKLKTESAGNTTKFAALTKQLADIEGLAGDMRKILNDRIDTLLEQMTKSPAFTRGSLDVGGPT